jgi:nitroreductase
MEVLEALRARRTVRQYVPDYVIPADVLQELVNLGLDAPTGRNRQEIDLIVITNKSKIDEISRLTLEGFAPEHRSVFDARVADLGVKNVVTCDASAVIVLVSNERRLDTDSLQVDAGIVAMTIMTAAPNFGLATMALGCLIRGGKAKVEEAIGAEPGSLIIGLAIGKPKENLKLSEKTKLAKATII